MITVKSGYIDFKSIFRDDTVSLQGGWMSTLKGSQEPWVEWLGSGLPLNIWLSEDELGNKTRYKYQID